jgi:NAD(P)-dependent dehydrogenase (short-subunit alcohol dehydrogenase family)
MSETRNRGAIGTTLAGVAERLDAVPLSIALDEHERLDGLVALVTSANVELGTGIALGLADRGATVWMACRNQWEEAGASVRQQAGSEAIHGVALDLNEWSSIAALVRELAERGLVIDRLVLNARVQPVNLLGNIALVDALLAAGVLVPMAPEPRIIVVGSDSHRAADEVDVGALVGGGFDDTMLLLHTWCEELGRRLWSTEGERIAVHHLCPGDVGSWTEAMLRTVLARSPARAARAVVWLAASHRLIGRTRCYLDGDQEALAADATADAALGARVWEESHALIAAQRGPDAE